MGIYVFTADKLYKYLEEDDQNPDSSKDFGKDVLPTMLNAGEKMMSYRFEGYWKDVGTISALWESNMDLLGTDPTFDVGDPTWKIHSRNPLAPPEYISDTGEVNNSMIALGCEISGKVKHSVLSSNVVVEKGATVTDSVIMSGTVIKSGAKVCYSVIDENVTVGKKACIGADKDDASGITVLGRNIAVADGARVESGKIIDKDYKGE